MASVPVAEVGPRYQAAADPANIAIAALAKEALAYNAGPRPALGADEPSGVRNLGDAVAASVDRSGLTAAPRHPRRRRAIDVVRVDMSTLASARGNDIRPNMARLVADAGREVAAETSSATRSEC